jgi:hypothetical protein
VNRYAYYYCHQKCSHHAQGDEDQFGGLLRQLVPSPEWLLKETILSIWHDELGQVSDVRESVQSGSRRYACGFVGSPSRSSMNRAAVHCQADVL